MLQYGKSAYTLARGMQLTRSRSVLMQRLSAGACEQGWRRRRPAAGAQPAADGAGAGGRCAQGAGGRARE